MFFKLLLSILLSYIVLITAAPVSRLSKEEYQFVGNTQESMGQVINIIDFGAVPGDPIHNVTNQVAINQALKTAGNGDTVLIPTGIFYTVGGIYAENLQFITVRFDGTLFAVFDLQTWPFEGGNYKDFFQLRYSNHITLTTSLQTATINGNGKPWWNGCILGTLPHGDSRPKFFTFQDSSDILTEKLTLINSPSWNLLFEKCARVEARYVDIIVDRSYQKELKQILSDRRFKEDLANSSFFGKMFKKVIHSWILQPEDLNTDGIDMIGHDFWVHQCNIQNDDDSIAVKPSHIGFESGNCSEHMLIENTVLTGFGASIGSVPPRQEINCVNNITFFNISMPHTGKGIYIQSNPSCGPGQSSIISNIRYENVSITNPVWWAIWIGPQQQHQPHTKLGQLCALDYPISRNCPTQGCTDFVNITLKNVLITNSFLSPGVMLGNSTNPMKNIVFDNVVVKKSGRLPFISKKWPFKGTYQCINIEGTSINSHPAPPCFQQQNN